MIGVKHFLLIKVLAIHQNFLHLNVSFTAALVWGFGMGDKEPSGVGSSRARFMKKRCHSDLQNYQLLEEIGRGSYGLVYKAYHRKTRKEVALKKVLKIPEGTEIPSATVREVKSLTFLKDENIIELIEICQDKASLTSEGIPTYYLVFDFCEHDLKGLLMSGDVKFDLGETKMVLNQLFNGLDFIHSGGYLHGDIKPANIFVTKDGKIKIGDFGLAIKIADVEKHSHKIISLWYRPPEILLDVTKYEARVDVWSAGCIMLEMLTSSKYLKGSKTEQEQFHLIRKFCGPIFPEAFPTAKNLELLNQCDAPKRRKRRSRSRNKRRKRRKSQKPEEKCYVKSNLKASVENEYALDLLSKLLTVNPEKRINSFDALNHDFFQTDPAPCELATKLQSLNSRFS